MLFSYTTTPNGTGVTYSLPLRSHYDVRRERREGVGGWFPENRLSLELSSVVSSVIRPSKKTV